MIGIEPNGCFTFGFIRGSNGDMVLKRGDFVTLELDGGNVRGCVKDIHAYLYGCGALRPLWVYNVICINKPVGLDFGSNDKVFVPDRLHFYKVKQA